MLSYACLATLLVVILAAVTGECFALLLLSAITSHAGVFFFRTVSVRTYSESGGGILAGFISAIQIVVMNAVSSPVARRLADMENHSTGRGYRAALAAKQFLFRATNR